MLIIGCILLIAMLDVSVTGEIVNEAIDISHFQANPNFKRVVQSGITTIIHKATQGITYRDPVYAKSRRAAIAAGVKYWGAYHFADGENGDAQAKYFLNVAKDAMFHVIDLETNPTQGRKTVGLKQAEDLATGIKSRTGRYPIVYGSSHFLDQWNSSTVLASCPLWIASWAEKPVLPKMWNNWILWQYTDGVKGPEPHTVPGIGRCDRDKINKEYFNKYLSK